MKDLDISTIIEERALDKKELARALFPDNKHPDHALRRILDGTALLDTDQLQLLADRAGLPLSELFSKGGWTATRTGPDVHVFKQGHFRAELDLSTGTTRLYKNDALVCEEILHSGLVPLSTYLDGLKKLIHKHK